MKIGIILPAFLLAVACNSSSSSDLQPSNKALIPDDLPIDYVSAEEALERLPSRPGIQSVRDVAPGVKQYSSGVSELTNWYAFGKGSYAYPTVVRSRVVGTPENFVVKTTILCSATLDICDRVRKQFSDSLQR